MEVMWDVDRKMTVEFARRENSQEKHQNVKGSPSCGDRGLPFEEFSYENV